MKSIKLFIILQSFSLSVQAQQTKNPDFTIDVHRVVGENTQFWKAAGSDHLFYHVLRPSGQTLLDRMEASGSHRYMRSHNTFVQDTKNGVIRGQEVYSEDDTGNPRYDFSNVNRVFAEYVKRGIKPIVEYDYLPEALEIKDGMQSAGNDEGMSMRNTGPGDWQKWSDLMKAATRNFVRTFGAEEVRTWYFEVWNEPDGWPNEEMDVFFRMYDVFVDAVTSVDSALRVGGPACYHEYFLRPFLNHVVNGINHVTGEKGTRIDFISYHIYGLSGKWLNSEPHIRPQVQRFTQAVLWLKRMMKNFPELKGVEFHINEWGLSSNYYRTVEDHPDLVYRNNIESALFLVKLVNSLFQIEDNYNFPVSMLLYWGFAGEADEDEFFAGKRDLTTAGDIPKPIQTGFEMLARLEKERLLVQRPDKDNRLGILATGSGERVSLIVYNYEEADQDLERSDAITVDLAGLNPGAEYQIRETILDREHNNSYSVWKEMGRPATTQGIDMAAFRRAGELTASCEYTIHTGEDGTSQIELTLQRHSMKLLEISLLKY